MSAGRRKEFETYDTSAGPGPPTRSRRLGDREQLVRQLAVFLPQLVDLIQVR